MENLQLVSKNVNEKQSASTCAQIKEEVLNAEEIDEIVKNRTLASYFSSGEGLKKTVSIFGQSEDEIEKEFKNYRRKRFLIN